MANWQGKGQEWPVVVQFGRKKPGFFPSERILYFRTERFFHFQPGGCALARSRVGVGLSAMVRPCPSSLPIRLLLNR